MERDPTGIGRVDGTTVLDAPTLDDTGTSGPDRPATDGPPARLGRYIPLTMLGAGGMGVVYAAIDTQLGRRVAVKVLPHGRRWAINAAPRLRREARALARLAHPNVVAIYDVGEADGTVYVAMELCEGQTLTAWQKSEPRAWTEIVDVYLQAGEGLAAAHREGLVHRDFKPDNAIIDRQTRVRVLDFGLAMAFERDGSDDDEPPIDPADSIDDVPPYPADSASVHARVTTTGPADSANDALPHPADSASVHARVTTTGSADSADDALPRAADGASVHARLTATGTIMGTPAYMAPEQMAGVQADARSDQFSFCVALYEALYGTRPFSGRNLREIRAAVFQGELTHPDERSVPAWLRRIIVRGLHCDPDQRWPTMTALLGALRQGRRPAGRRWRWLVTAGLVTAGALAIGTPSTLAGSRCTRVASMDAAWNDAVRQALRRSLLATELPYAADTWSRIEPPLDRYAAEWSAQRQAVCQTVQNRAVSDTVHDVRVACLDERRSEFEALVGVLGQADAPVVARAADAVSQLPPIHPCADLERHRDAPAPVDSVRVAAIHDDLAHAHALELAGRYEDGLRSAERARRLADSLGDPALIAETHLRVGTLQERLGDYAAAERALSTAAWLAVEARRDAFALSAMIPLTGLVGYELARRDEGLDWGRHAEAAIARSGAAAHERARLSNNLGAVYDRAGDLTRAREHYTRALAHIEDTEGDAARRERAHTLNNLANTSARLGDLPRAQAQLEDALAITEAMQGPEHPQVAIMLANLANVQTDRGQLDESERHHRRALGIRERALGPDHPLVGSSLLNLGNALQARGDARGALPLFERAVAVKEAAVGPDHHQTAIAINNLGDVLRDLGRAPEAIAAHRRALEIWTHQMGPSHPMIAYPLTNLGLDLIADDQPRAALEPLARAVELRESTGAEPSLLGVSRLGLARALEASGEDPEYAYELGQQAWEQLSGSSPRYARQRMIARAWLDAHAPPEPPAPAPESPL